MAATADGHKPLIMLGIESSCDDTGVAVLTSDGKVLGEAIATQAELHAPWGGVVPSIAQAAHKEAIDRVVDSALSQAGLTAAQLDAVAFTVGPGLSLCLDVGVRKAREVSRLHSLPLVPVHHMEVRKVQGQARRVDLIACQQNACGNVYCHITDMCPAAAIIAAFIATHYVAAHMLHSSCSCSWHTRSLVWLFKCMVCECGSALPLNECRLPAEHHFLLPCGPRALQAHALVARMSAGGAAQLPFPFLCLLVSGGHNLLVLVKGVGHYMQLGTTLDDALGEALAYT